MMATETAVVPAEAERFVQSVFAAETALAEVNTLAEAVEIRDQAEAIRQFADTARYGEKFLRLAGAFKLRAERKVGELLAELERGTAGRPSEISDSVSPISDYRRTLDDLHIETRTAQRWQLAAAVSISAFDSYVAEATEVTVAGLLRHAKHAPLTNKPHKQSRRQHQRAQSAAYAALTEAFTALDRAARFTFDDIMASLSPEQKVEAGATAWKHVAWLKEIAAKLEGIGG